MPWLRVASILANAPPTSPASWPMRTAAIPMAPAVKYELFYLRPFLYSLLRSGHIIGRWHLRRVRRGMHEGVCARLRLRRQHIRQPLHGQDGWSVCARPRGLQWYETLAGRFLFHDQPHVVCMYFTETKQDTAVCAQDEDCLVDGHFCKRELGKCSGSGACTAKPLV